MELFFVLMVIFILGVLIMATVQTINDKLDALSADVDRVAALALADEREEGNGAATQAQVDAIDSKVAAIQAKVAAIQDNPPAAPSITASADANHAVTLNWASVPEAVSYNVKRGNATGAEIFLSNTAALSFTDSTTVAGTLYFYMVSAVEADGAEGKNSAEVSVTA